MRQDIHQAKAAEHYPLTDHVSDTGQTAEEIVATYIEPDGTPKPGSVQVLLADPPWGDKSQRGKKLGAIRHYPLMDDAALVDMGDAIKHITAEDSVCFMWVTSATLPFGLELLKHWGFQYKSFRFWGKLLLGLGYPYRNSGELMLYGKRGKGVDIKFKGEPNFFIAGRGAHSEKPPEAHASIDRLVGPDPVRLELFARRPAPSPHPWWVWGNEVASDISLARWGYPVPSDARFTSTDFTETNRAGIENFAQEISRDE